MTARSLAPRQKLALAFVFVWFFVGGIVHFVFTQAEMRIVPPVIPWPFAAVIATGILELVGAAGLVFASTRPYAAFSLAALTLAVTPANVYMLQQAGQFPALPYWALVVRLPLQVLLLALIIWIARWPRRA